MWKDMGKWPMHPAHDFYYNVLHFDEAPVLGTFRRIIDLALQLSLVHGPLRYAYLSEGGGSSGSTDNLVTTLEKGRSVSP